MRLKCLVCKASFDLDEEYVDKSLDWMECPFCGALSKNVLKGES